MEQSLISYNVATVAVKSTLTPITTSEQTLVTITDPKFLRASQMTMYLSVALGSATSVKLRVYFSPDNGTTYYQAPIKNLSTGILADTPSVVDSTSPAQSSNKVLIEDVPISACTAIKITGTSVGASTGTVNAFIVMVRDN